MVTADEKHRDMPQRKRRQKLVQYRNGFCDRHIFIINISCQKNCLYTVFFGNGNDLLQQFFLLRQKCIVIHFPPQVQIAEM